ncbi:phage virion morphogenesis protein [Inquilinus limosus]|uniref:phage virion morphogenesis protein n=1 Tax=Inquilinus limosus TaxID=171674 RepID=UPI000691EFDE|nr:phage virion morphogenesis protein [Inquilinus limosus]
MTGVSLHVDSAVVRAALGRVSERMTNARGLYDNIGAAMVVSTQMRFEREQAPDGSPWPKPLRVLIEGGNTLRLSNRLFGSLTHVADNQGVEWGSDAEYARIHQLGGTVVPKAAGALHFKLPGDLGWRFASSVTIPARPYLGIDDDDTAEIVAQAEDWLAVAEGQP